MSILFGLGLAILLFILWLRHGVIMPGRSWEGEVDASATREAADLSVRLHQHVEHLASTIGPRHVWNGDTLERTASYIEHQFQSAGFEVRSLPFKIESGRVEVRNLEVELPGRGASDEVVVVGAHYDTVPGSPGADDNASGIAALLEIAKSLRSESLRRSLRLVAFVNEEEPYAETDGMGSIVYARALREQGVAVHCMLALESIGYYRDEPGSQVYPWPLHLVCPSTANFLAFVGNVRSRTLLRATIASFRMHAKLPSEGVSIPERWAPDISRSDHAAFWRMGYAAIMVTDTVPFRNPHYHTPDDKTATLNFQGFGFAVQGLIATIKDLANQ
jgi:Zn-dependent M28 family amino/carboxypeptidase